LVVVTLKPVAFEKFTFPPLIVETFRVEMVPVVAERTVVLRAVVVTLVNVAFVPTTFWSEVSPRTVNVLVTVLDAATNPPNKLNVEVAEAPRAVTVARVSVSAKR
jgi:hypothetical protein